MPVGHLYVFGEMSIYVFLLLIGLVFFSFMSCLYILEIKPLWVKSLANIFSQSVGFVSILFMVSFAVQRLVSLIRSSLFVFISIVLGNWHQKTFY